MTLAPLRFSAALWVNTQNISAQREAAIAATLKATTENPVGFETFGPREVGQSSGILVASSLNWQPLELVAKSFGLPYVLNPDANLGPLEPTTSEVRQQLLNQNVSHYA